MNCGGGCRPISIVRTAIMTATSASLSSMERCTTDRNSAMSFHKLVGPRLSLTNDLTAPCAIPLWSTFCPVWINDSAVRNGHGPTAASPAAISFCRPRGDTLFTQAFDSGRMEPSGQPAPLLRLVRPRAAKDFSLPAFLPACLPFQSLCHLP